MLCFLDHKVKINTEAINDNFITKTIVEERTENPECVKLKLSKSKKKKVSWTTETVDNETMNKKKSKCCCIYNKPTEFGVSSEEEEDDEECENCFGHKMKSH